MHTLAEAARAHGGLEDPANGQFYFQNFAAAKIAAESLGATVDDVPPLANRVAYLGVGHGGVLMLRVPAEGIECFTGYITNKKWHSRALGVKADQRDARAIMADIDPLVRRLVTREGDSHKAIGWVTFDVDGRPNFGSKHDAWSYLIGKRFTRAQADEMLGHAVSRPWEVVNIPFAPEYEDGQRTWNLNAAQYRFPPGERGPHPTWNAVLKHCGADLDDSLSGSLWAQRTNIRTGAQYLTAWIACMLREPQLKLPYLFLFGDQNNGKSTLHRAVARLMTGGVVSADRALRAEHNGELARGVLAYIEETDLSSSKTAYNKIKDLTTNDEIWIRRMCTDLYRIPNMLHFIQTANERSYCPMTFGDTRVVALYVRPFAEDELIPPGILMARLEAEAPQFMRTLMDTELPKPVGRMALPVIESQSKVAAMETHVSDFAVALVDYMATHRRASLTCAKLSDAFGPGRWPTDLRRVKAEADEHRIYFERSGIKFNYPRKRTKHGFGFVVTRSANVRSL